MREIYRPDEVYLNTLELKKLTDYNIMPIFPVESVTDPQISPDGTKILFTYTTTNVKENRLESHIWLLNLVNNQQI